MAQAAPKGATAASVWLFTGPHVVIVQRIAGPMQPVVWVGVLVIPTLRSEFVAALPRPKVGHMKNHILAKRFAASLLATALFSSLSADISIASAEDGSTPAADPRLAMITALEALGPHPSLGDQANVFARLIGTWGVEYTDFSQDGKETHRSGELIIGWVLDGRGIQDVWIVDPSGARKEREVYTDVRYFDPKTRTWPAIFVDPEHASVAKFTGTAVGDDRIVLVTQDFADKETRWSVNDLRPNSFVWREEESSDGGKTWRLQAQHQMKRRSEAAP